MIFVRKLLGVRRSRFIKSEDGATAAEFALVSIPFIILLFGIIEIAIIFAANLILESGTQEAARLIRTGQFSASQTATQFKEELCNRVSVLLDCDDSLYIDVVTFNNFGGSTPPPPPSPSSIANGGSFTLGGQGAITLVRTYYAWDIITPLIGTLFSDFGANKRLVMASVVFKNEPFGN